MGDKSEDGLMSLRSGGPPLGTPAMHLALHQEHEVEGRQYGSGPVSRNQRNQ